MDVEHRLAAELAITHSTTKPKQEHLVGTKELFEINAKAMNTRLSANVLLARKVDYKAVGLRLKQRWQLRFG